MIWLVDRYFRAAPRSQVQQPYNAEVRFAARILQYQHVSTAKCYFEPFQQSSTATQTGGHHLDGKRPPSSSTPETFTGSERRNLGSLRRSIMHSAPSFYFGVDTEPLELWIDRKNLQPRLFAGNFL
jgi:hypothetical protein